MSVCGTGLKYLELSGFSWKPLPALSDCPKALGTIGFQLKERIYLPLSKLTPFNVLFRQYADLSSLRPHFAVPKSTGILTGFPSTSPFGLALGPDLP